jgi:lysophospholipase L1-like esterase
MRASYRATIDWFRVIFLLMSAIVAVAQKPTTIFLAGDSTVAEKLPAKRPETGWGEFLQPAFDRGHVRVENHAKNGRSTRTFISEGLWLEIVDKLQPGDYVFIEFGHNDESPEKADRYTPPADFEKNLVRMVRDVRGKEAFPVLLTPVVRRNFDGQGNFVDKHGVYPDVTRKVARDFFVPLIDMHRESERVLKQYGPEESCKLFLQLQPGENPNYPDGVTDNTHFNPVGAQIMAELAVEGIRAANLDIARYLKVRDAK